ncbi:J domain-containing protein [archaeon]|nr:MAG: J domain-containing protein [archaeon]
MREPDLYEVLGVSSDATAEQIRAAWKRAAHATHPDKGGSAGSSGASNDRFVAVKSAYDVLRDPSLRAEYDATVRGHELTPAQLADLKRRAALFDAHLKGEWQRALNARPARDALLVLCMPASRAASNRAHIKVMKVVERVLRPSTLVGMALLAAVRARSPCGMSCTLLLGCVSATRTGGCRGLLAAG